MKAYVVEVNEGVVEATRQGIDWWLMFRRYEVTGRIRETKAACVVGGTVEVACESREHADWLANHMVEHGGLPRTAVTVKAVSQPVTHKPATPDHPHVDPGDGRTECDVCGKWVWPVIHSCKGVPVTARARARAGLPPEVTRP